MVSELTKVPSKDLTLDIKGTQYPFVVLEIKLTESSTAQLIISNEDLEDYLLGDSLLDSVDDKIFYYTEENPHDLSLDEYKKILPTIREIVGFVKCAQTTFTLSEFLSDF